MRFKDLLRQLRKDADLTQEELADRAGIPVTSLRGHEQGQRIPSWASVVRFARALGISTDRFSNCDEVADGSASKRPRGRSPKARPLEVKKPRARKRT
jgi:transcriptional regulator with XRE-family HTH domain